MCSVTSSRDCSGVLLRADKAECSCCRAKTSSSEDISQPSLATHSAIMSAWLA